MKKFLIGSMVAMLCMGASAAYADDTHQHEHGSAPETKSSAGTNVLPSQPAASDKSMSSAGNCNVSDAQMGKAQERMKQAQAIMAKLRKAKDPAKRRKLMQEHTQAMRDIMGMMHDMKTDRMGCGQGMGMMSCGQGMGAMGGDHKMGSMGAGQGMGMMGDDHKMGAMGGDQGIGMMGEEHKMGPMSGVQGMGKMSEDHRMGPMGSDQGMGMMGMHQIMEERMEMMQMMLEQMFERQEMLMQDKK
jgi:hypothetical protein